MFFTDNIQLLRDLAAALLGSEGLAVGAVELGRVVVTSAHLDLFKAAIISAAAVVFAVFY